MAPDVPSWLRDALFYQVFPDRFAASPRVDKPAALEPWSAPPTVHGFKGGDLLGIVERMDHLTDLGMNAIYLNPVFVSASNHRYHTYDYLHVDPLLGGDKALRVLLDEAHARGMRVILDGVFNHSGRGFWPFHHVLESGRSSPYVGWFHFDPRRLAEERQVDAYPDAHLRGPADGSWAEAHRAGIGSLEALGYRAWWDLAALPKLNVDNPAVRRYLFDVARHWTRFGADGWRFDVPEEIAVDFWEEMRDAVRDVNPEAYLVGEIWHPAPEWLAPRGPFDGLMNYPMAWAIIGFAAGDALDLSVPGQPAEMQRFLRPLDAAAFAGRLAELAAVYGPETGPRQLNLLGSHDTPRLLTMCGGDARAAEIALLLLMTMPGAPCVYYGDEIGLQGAGDPHCRAGFPWDEEMWELSIMRALRAAAALRTTEPGLRAPGVERIAAVGRAVVLGRGTGTQRLLVAANAGRSIVELTVATSREPPRARTLLTVGGEVTVTTSGSDLLLRLPPRSASVLRPVA